MPRQFWLHTEFPVTILRPPSPVTTLARKLRLHDYFALGFGTMIGVGWLVLMDDWLARGGPLGAALAFALGCLILLPVGYVYGKWVQRLPDASGEAAYTAQVFPPLVSFFTGWIMLLAYFIVCPWEAVAIGKLAAYLFPSLDSFKLYSVAGQPVFLPRLLLGVALTILLTFLNYRGIRASARFQGWITSAVLILFAVAAFFSLRRGSFSNIHPAFRSTPFLSILLTLQIVPYFMTGFESIPKVAEEAHPGFPPRSFFRAIVLALFIGAGFYVLSIVAVSFAAPWQSLLGKSFATAIAFEHAIGSHWPVALIVIAGICGLCQCFNGNFVAASRLLFSFGRRATIPSGFASIHPRHQTPHVAVLAISAGTLLGVFLGDALLVPVTEVGSMASAFGWLAACLSLALVESLPRVRLVALLGALVSALLFAMKLFPIFPGHFSRDEWFALSLWLLIGILLHALSPVIARRNASSSTT
ncbi:MAG TPA: APC family permease [Candidatus Acidoferrum sp.]|nr:APC family permease [Candidatus Acidoferrum sp.]